MSDVLVGEPVCDYLCDNASTNPFTDSPRVGLMAEILEAVAISE